MTTAFSDSGAPLDLEEEGVFTLPEPLTAPLLTPIGFKPRIGFRRHTTR
jgi:hypothetical protein